MGVWVCIMVVESFYMFCELEGRVDLVDVSTGMKFPAPAPAILQRGPTGAALQPYLQILFLV